MSRSDGGHDDGRTDSDPTAARVGRDAIGELAGVRLREFTAEYEHVVDMIGAGDDPTAEELADLREAHRGVQSVIETRFAPLVDSADPWEGAADRIPYGELARTFGVPLERLQEADGELEE